jgi:hypothetical protein
MSITLNIKLDTKQLERCLKTVQSNIKNAVGKAMAKEAALMKSALRAQVSGAMKVEKRAFLNSFSAKVLDFKGMPAIRAGTQVRWAGIHETGGSISGKMLIPLNGRIGRKRFKAIVDDLMRSGNAFFVKGHSGKVVLMAENIAENSRSLSIFKRRHRKAAGIKRLKRGTAIPIAILVPKVTLGKRLDVERLIRGRVPSLMRGIEKELAGIQ